MCALVAADLTRLPAFDAVAGKRNPARTTAVTTAMKIMSEITQVSNTQCVLSHDDGTTRVVLCPLLSEIAPENDLDFAAWLSLSELAGSPLYRPVGYAFAHINTFIPRGEPTTLGQLGQCGARPLAAVLPVPAHATPNTTKWDETVKNDKRGQ